MEEGLVDGEVLLQECLQADVLVGCEHMWHPGFIDCLGELEEGIGIVLRNCDVGFGPGVGISGSLLKFSL